MYRYFLEVSYKGTRYSGFQIQQNANSIQGEIERVFKVVTKQQIELTGSSRTDAGVHAEQNYFHFDVQFPIPLAIIYNLNALLPADIALLSLRAVNPDAHCRFDAISREYIYTVYTYKNPFLSDTAYYFPYALNFSAMAESARLFLGTHDFSTFSKRNTQVKTFICSVAESEWFIDEGVFRYRVKANRFLRGMVRGLVGTMLMVGRNKLTIEDLEEIFKSGDSARADFSVPGRGLCLKRVVYISG